MGRLSLPLTDRETATQPRKMRSANFAASRNEAKFLDVRFKFSSQFYEVEWTWARVHLPPEALFSDCGRNILAARSFDVVSDPGPNTSIDPWGVKSAVVPQARSRHRGGLFAGSKAVGEREMNWAKLADEALAGFPLSSIPPTVELPALPHVVTLFVQRSRDEAAPLHELAEVLETDSALTIELLKYVNSSSCGLRSKAKTVLQAITLLGCARCRLFVIATGMEAAVRAQCSKLIDQTAFWSDTLQKAIFAREIAILLRTDPDVAFVGALLQDYLLPFLTNALTEDYRKFFGLRATPLAMLSKFEQSHFGWDHALVGACLAHAWGLPGDLVCCILYHHAGLQILTDPKLGRTPVAASALSALLRDQFCLHDHGFELLAKLERKWPAFCLERIAESVDRQHQEMGLGVRRDSSLLQWCKDLGHGPLDAPVSPLEPAARS
jgi:HD-like signal output (HDOD) protein